MQVRDRSRHKMETCWASVKVHHYQGGSWKLPHSPMMRPQKDYGRRLLSMALQGPPEAAKCVTQPFDLLPLVLTLGLHSPPSLMDG